MRGFIRIRVSLENKGWQQALLAQLFYCLFLSTDNGCKGMSEATKQTITPLG